MVAQRRYYSGEILTRADTDIRENGPEELKAFEESPMKDDKIMARVEGLIQGYKILAKRYFSDGGVEIDIASRSVRSASIRRSFATALNCCESSPL